MATIFWNKDGRVPVHYPNSGKYINKTVYEPPLCGQCQDLD